MTHKLVLNNLNSGQKVFPEYPTPTCIQVVCIMCSKVKHEFMYDWSANSGSFTWIGVFTHQRTAADNGK